MPVPVSQMWTVASYVLRQKLAGRKHYPLVLMLEPLFRCNLACAGCGKIQYPAHILKKDLSPEECFRAVDECGAPMVSIPGGEPLMHPEIDKIVEGLVARKKYIYLCTNALLLKEKIHLFKPSKYLTFSVHLDGQREEHDLAVCREGGYDIAVDAVKEALKRGFRVTTNTTLFDGANPKSVRAFFDEMMDLGVEGMMLSPGIFLRQGSRPETFPRPRPYPPHVPRDPLEPQEELAVQSVAAVSRIPDGQAHLSLHAVGHADVQRLRLAKTLLPAARRLRGNFQGIAVDDRMAELRHRVGQSGLRELHGPQRLRSERGQRDLQLARRIPRDSESDAVHQLIEMKKPCDMLEEPQAPVNPLIQIAAKSTAQEHSLQETRA